MLRSLHLIRGRLGGIVCLLVTAVVSPLGIQDFKIAAPIQIQPYPAQYRAAAYPALIRTGNLPFAGALLP